MYNSLKNANFIPTYNVIINNVLFQYFIKNYEKNIPRPKE